VVWSPQSNIALFADPASKAPGATQTFAEIDKMIRAVYPNPIALAQ
jgi:hypothetical protein